MSASDALRGRCSVFTIFNMGTMQYLTLYRACATRALSCSHLQVGPPDHAAVSADCPYTGKGDGSSLPNCETSCIASASCTAINWNAGIGDCVFRLCANPLHPQISPGYPGYTTFGLNQTAGPAIFTAWHTDTGVLSSLCAADPTGCGGFNSNGVLYTDVSSTVSAPGVTLYVPA